MPAKDLTPQVPGETQPEQAPELAPDVPAVPVLPEPKREPVRIPKTFGHPILTPQGWVVPEPHQKPKA